MYLPQLHNVYTSDLMKQDCQSIQFHDIVHPGCDSNQNNCMHREICRPSMIHL